MYHQNIQCRVGFAMMSPSAISFLLRILGWKGKLARKASGENYLIEAVTDYRSCGAQMTYLIDEEATCAMSTQRGVTLGS